MSDNGSRMKKNIIFGKSKDKTDVAWDHWERVLLDELNSSHFSSISQWRKRDFFWWLIDSDFMASTMKRDQRWFEKKIIEWRNIRASKCHSHIVPRCKNVDKMVRDTLFPIDLSSIVVVLLQNLLTYFLSREREKMRKERKIFFFLLSTLSHAHSI